MEMRSQLPLAFRSAFRRLFLRSISLITQIVRSFSSRDCRWVPKESTCPAAKYLSGSFGAEKK